VDLKLFIQMTGNGGFEIIFSKHGRGGFVAPFRQRGQTNEMSQGI
jgi:hypothetical protein